MSLSFRNRHRIALASTVLLLLGGCLSLGGSNAITVYSPQLKTEAKSDWPAVTWPLLVGKPLASAVLDSDGIAVRPQPGLLQVYHGVNWADPAPEMLQTVLVQAFEDSGKIGAVGRESSGMRGDYVLLLDMRQFEAVYADPEQAPSVVVELQAKLLSNPDGRVLSAKTFRAEVPAADAAIPAVVDAFDAAMTHSVSDIVGWTLETGNTDAHKATAEQ